MKFGLFDHVDRNQLPLAEQFDRRIEFVAATDEAGYYALPIAEHHATPLNMVPVPGVYLGAIANATKNIRLGPLVYLLPLYSPLRLIEEVGMLDHLWHGRLEIGVGRGVSPFEMNFHNFDTDTARAVFHEAFEVLLLGMSTDRLNYEGKHFNYSNVPMELPPLQKPHPPIWYPSSAESGSTFAGENGYDFGTLGSIELAKKNVSTYKAALAKRGGPLLPREGFAGGSAISVTRHLVLADTDDEALEIAKPAYTDWYSSLTKLQRENVQGPNIAAAMEANPLEARGKGAAIVGSPETVKAEIERQVAEIGINYMIIGFYFGTIAHEDAMRSMKLFAEEVMPKVSDLVAA